MLVFVDTQILVWGIRKHATRGQEDELKKAESFFDNAKSNNLIIGIAAPTLSEYLMGTPVEKHTEAFHYFNTHFRIFPFDTLAALKGAQLWEEHYKNLSLRQIIKDTGYQRQVLKVDHQIVSIAVSNKADCIYSHDQGLKKFGSRFIPIKELEPVQLSLFPKEAAAAKEDIY